VLSIVGAGFEEERVQALAASLGIASRVQFHGEVRGDADLLPLFQESIAYMTPGCVGLGLLHGFAYGVPTVTTMNPSEGRHGQEFVNLKHAVNALVLESEALLKDAIVTLCNEPVWARRLGVEAYRTYRETRRLDQMVAGFCAAIEYVTRYRAAGQARAVLPKA
jgi:glycosyltransferase involved in cell wall biosynthesis